MDQHPLVETQKTLSIKRTFLLPLESVWKAFSEVESFKKWWGPKGYSCPHCSIDFKVGGKYFASMLAPDGTETWSIGTYKEIVPMKKIVYSDSFADSKGNIVPASYYNMPGNWELALNVTLEFEQIEDRTTLSIKHEGLPVEAIDDCAAGWQSCFDKLESSIK